MSTSKITLLIFASLCVPVAEAGTPLQEAMNTELKALRAERQALRKAVEEVTVKQGTAIRGLEKEVERRTARLTRARSENALNAESLPEKERARSQVDQVDQLEALSAEIQAWLPKVEESKTSSRTETKTTGAWLKAAIAHIIQTKPVRREPKREFFDSEGRRANGTLILFSRVAALVEGSLAPLTMDADGSYLELHGFTPSARPAGYPQAVDLFLYDPNAPAGTAHYHPETFAAWMERGGPLMWVLLAFGILALIIAAERSIVVGNALLKGRRIQRLCGTTSRHELPKLLGPLAKDMLIAPLWKTVEPSKAIEAREERAALALEEVKTRLDRGVSWLAVVAAVSPLLGLLGTVTGMIGTFSVITSNGTRDPQQLSAGISEALLTTQLGLAVAVPALLLHTGLLRLAHSVVAGLEREALRLIEANSSEDQAS